MGFKLFVVGVLLAVVGAGFYVAHADRADAYVHVTNQIQCPEFVKKPDTKVFVLLDSSLSDDLKSMVRDSVDDWNKSDTTLKLTVTDKTVHDVNPFIEITVVAEPGQNAGVAGTTQNELCSQVKIAQVIRLYSESILTWKTYPRNSNVMVISHEIGHALGLDHVPYTPSSCSSIMEPSPNIAATFWCARGPKVDDVAGVRSLFSPNLIQGFPSGSFIRSPAGGVLSSDGVFSTVDNFKRSGDFADYRWSFVPHKKTDGTFDTWGRIVNKSTGSCLASFDIRSEKLSEEACDTTGAAGYSLWWKVVYDGTRTQLINGGTSTSPASRDCLAAHVSVFGATVASTADCSAPETKLTVETTVPGGGTDPSQPVTKTFGHLLYSQQNSGKCLKAAGKPRTGETTSLSAAECLESDTARWEYFPGSKSLKLPAATYDLTDNPTSTSSSPAASPSSGSQREQEIDPKESSGDGSRNDPNGLDDSQRPGSGESPDSRDSGGQNSVIYVSFCVTGSASGEGSPVTLQQCTPESYKYQSWTFKPNGNIVNNGNGLCLSTNSTQAVVQTACTNNAAWGMPDLWKEGEPVQVVAAGGGASSVNKYLDFNTPASDLVLKGEPTAGFGFDDLEAPYVFWYQPGKCVVGGADSANGARCGAPTNNPDSLLWLPVISTTAGSNGLISFKNKQSNKCFANTETVPIVVSDCTTSGSASQWRIIPSDLSPNGPASQEASQYGAGRCSDDSSSSTPATVTVPAWAGSVEMQLFGGKGSDSNGVWNGGGNTGGAGGAVKVTYPVEGNLKPGSKLVLVRGCNGKPAPGGDPINRDYRLFPGGSGWSNGGSAYLGGGTGGGASAIYPEGHPDNPYAVAGGGGGAGGGRCSGKYGWKGGAGGSGAQTRNENGYGPSGGNGVAAGDDLGRGGDNTNSGPRNGYNPFGNAYAESGGGGGYVGGKAGNWFGDQHTCDSQGGGGGGSSFIATKDVPQPQNISFASDGGSSDAYIRFIPKPNDPPKN